MSIIQYHDLLKPDHLALIKEVIQAHKLIIYPTDTLYGIGGDFYSREAMIKTDEFKGRHDKPYSVAVSDLDMLKTLVAEIPDPFYQMAGKLLPGRFTFIFKPCPKIDPRLLKNSGRIGIRIPDKPNLLKMISFLQTPLVSTSINLTGETPLNSMANIINMPDYQRFQAEIPVLIDHDPMPDSVGSTIVDLTTTPMRVIRQGDDYKKLLDFNPFRE